MIDALGDGRERERERERESHVIQNFGYLNHQARVICLVYMLLIEERFQEGILQNCDGWLGCGISHKKLVSFFFPNSPLS